MIRIATLLLLAIPAFVSAQDSGTDKGDWPQWRGPHRDAICTETGLLKEWPKEGPPLLWKHTGLGGGYSTPAIREWQNLRHELSRQRRSRLVP